MSTTGQSQAKWSHAAIQALFKQPFADLITQAQCTLRQHFNPNHIQISTLMSIKTGACPEDCRYCPQSGHYNTTIDKEKLCQVDEVVDAAKQAKAGGATRFCMGAAWRSPPDKALPTLLEMVRAVKALGLETCITAGMLSAAQAGALKEAGLDYYNHNLDTSPEYYPDIISTRTYQDRLDTLEKVRQAGMRVCCGGILNLGESQADRISLLAQLANMDEPPESVPINLLVPCPGTPLAKQQALDPFVFVRTIAVARIIMPRSVIRLSAGRNTMSDEMQALCFLAGANSLFYGEKLLTTPLPEADADKKLLERLGLCMMPADGSDAMACAVNE